MHNRLLNQTPVKQANVFADCGVQDFVYFLLNWFSMRLCGRMENTSKIKLWIRDCLGSRCTAICLL